ncbi:MAG: GNAT family N-acetyltransferase [Sphingobacteriaceae bacterium]|nr:MAG: GNAT family N-acetyltransferase [Sphingobacteriaceae bacterium]
MEHVLDNPAWYALISGNTNLAYGSDTVKFYDKDVAPFVGFDENTEDNFDVLYQLTAHNGLVMFISPQPATIPGKWKMLRHIPCLQMVHDGVPRQIDADIIDLKEEHIPQMLELTQLTKPGPFLNRTIDFGLFQGLFEGDKLAAMAGQRMAPLPYVEVTAVCTHPEYTGKGYAKQLLISQCNQIINNGHIPFLHVRDDNHRAIKVYEKVGFTTRTDMHFYMLRK